MYIPSHFEAPAKRTLLEILPAASFVQIVTADDDGVPMASHLPVSYDPDKGEFGTIYAHMARANPHWKLIEDRRSLVIFNGPHEYVSPRFYASKLNVPTWNYVAVHAYGTATAVTDPSDTAHILARLTYENEQMRDAPWEMGEINEGRLRAMMKAIVAFEIPVLTLEAKAKLGQNKKPDDKQALKEALKNSDLGAWQQQLTI